MLNLGGAELATLRLLEGLADRGLAPLLALNLPGGAAEDRVSGSVALAHLRPHAVPRPPATLEAHSLAGAARYASARLRQYAREWRFSRGEGFSAAVVGLQGLSPAFVCRRVRAARRLHFIRSDLRACDPTGRIHRTIARYAPRTDAYVCVSDAARASLVKLHPSVAEKAHTIPNLLGAAEMKRKADAPDPFPPRGGKRRVLTVARLWEPAKALGRMARVQAQLLRGGVDFDWFIVGDGPDRKMLEDEIARLGLSGRMHLLGAQANPYPYYAHADLVAVLSHYEGLCGAINEAKVLGRPVIATDVGAVREQLGGDGDGGLIVASEERAIAEGLAQLLANKAQCAAMAAVPLPSVLLDDEAKLDKLMALMAVQGAL